MVICWFCFVRGEVGAGEGVLQNKTQNSPSILNANLVLNANETDTKRIIVSREASEIIDDVTTPTIAFLRSYQKPVRHSYGLSSYQNPVRHSYGLSSYQKPVRHSYGLSSYQKPVRHSYGLSSYQKPVRHSYGLR